ncbi:phage tail length tape measure family protein [Dentiradicibacter hellwigii]|uniref:Phage tail length tape measure family protein n=1 Tax=Dentiradicibacter hellwigii TaxID=3149053 RepID=A0ABV4UHA5_9RHOO
MSELKVGVKVGYDGKELSSGIDNSRRKLSELAQATQQNEMSAKAMSAALRGVPAQFTDIVVALQSGQRPITVLLQQGGQLKDMFGGAVPAAKALGGYILGLINPLTITLTVATALGAAWYKGSQEADEFARALILTGNAAGTTVERLSQMRDAVAAATGATKGAAAEAITELASTGKVAESAMQGAAEAAVAMSRALGISVSDTVKEFNELGKSPAQAIRKLNEQYNFLHASQLQQIDDLEAVGLKTEAAQKAQELFGDALKSMASEAQQNLGYVERAWLAVKDAVKSTADAIASVGREAPLPISSLRSTSRSLSARLWPKKWARPAKSITTHPNWRRRRVSLRRA